MPQTEQQVLENVFIDRTKLPLLAYLIYNGRLAKDLLNKFIRPWMLGYCVATQPQDRQRYFEADDAKRPRCARGQDRQLRKYRFDADQKHVGRRRVGADQPEPKIGWRGVEPTSWVWNGSRQPDVSHLRSSI